MKIIIIIPWFGEWPGWTDYFLRSCGHNKQISWLIFTDASDHFVAPKNVKIEKMSLPQFNGLASEMLGMKIDVVNPYKICDLRPAFGEIFKNYIKNFDFWGYSDLDLIFGDIGNFISPPILNSSDIISCREDYQSGHFALYRNTEYINQLFKMSDAYNKVFLDNSKHYAFDEKSNLFGRKLHLKTSPGPIWKFYSLIELFFNKIRYKIYKRSGGRLPDMTSVTNEQTRTGNIRLFRKDMVRSDLWYRKNNISQWKIRWVKGKLTDQLSNEELLHFHFLKSKNNPEFKISTSGKKNDFSISPDGINPAIYMDIPK